MEDQKNYQNSHTSPPIFRLVLTGGPCGGKTTSSSVISERFQALGWRVFTVPEAATVLLSGGINFYNLTPDQVYNFQTNLLKVMMCLEDAFVDLARKSGQKSLVICDRGAMDCSAYIDQETWQAIVDENGWTTVGLRDSRYDCVVHLVSAADGAPKFYTTHDGSVRTETPELARELDCKIQNAWIGHPYLSIINNDTDFKKKIDRVIHTIANFVGETVPIAGLTKRKFLVENSPDNFPAGIKYQDYDVEHNYLVTSDKTQARLRKRGQFGTYAYTWTVRFPERHGQSLQLRRKITGREYITVRGSQCDSRRNTVCKKRRSFIYKNQYYELDTYTSCQPGLMLLEAYIPANADVNLPPFLGVVREVTKEKEYSMYNLALKDHPKTIAEITASQYRGADIPPNEPRMVDTAGYFDLK
uniref:TRPL translocation defect protein 14 isoform X3 n=1 Tax=Hirondellea gigas TaxID=1518452 RepID=A0A6A7G682_9CRUS